MCDKVLFRLLNKYFFQFFIDFWGVVLKKKTSFLYQKSYFEWLKMKFDPKFWYVSSVEGGLALPTGQELFIFEPFPCYSTCPHYLLWLLHGSSLLILSATMYLRDLGFGVMNDIVPKFDNFATLWYSLDMNLVNISIIEYML